MAARRGHGEGSLSRRADGRLEWKAPGGYRNGKRYRPAIYQRSGEPDKAFRKRIRDALKARDDGLPIATDDRLTVESYLERWYAATEPNVRPKTRRHFRWCMDHLIDGLGHHPLKQLQPHDLQIWLNRQRMSTQSVHHFRATLRLSLNYAMREGLLARNVATLVDVPEMERPEIHPLTAEQARVLIERWREDQHGALYATALLLGLRQGEALGLRWSDISLGDQANNGESLSNRFAREPSESFARKLAQSFVMVTKTATSKRTKTRASVRRLTIPPTLVTILREHRASQVRSIEGYVFPNQRGGPLDGTNVTHRFQRFCRVVGLPRIRFHDLRHSYATIMLARGVHPKKVADAMGHATTALFMSTYSHWTEGIAGEVAAEMEAAINL